MYSHRHRFNSISLSFFRPNTFNFFAFREWRKMSTESKQHVRPRKTHWLTVWARGGRPTPTTCFKSHTHICIYLIWSMYLHDFIQKRWKNGAHHSHSDAEQKQNPNQHTIITISTAATACVYMRSAPSWWAYGGGKSSGRQIAPKNSAHSNWVHACKIRMIA